MEQHTDAMFDQLHMDILSVMPPPDVVPNMAHQEVTPIMLQQQNKGESVRRSVSQAEQDKSRRDNNKKHKAAQKQHEERLSARRSGGKKKAA